MNNFDIAFLPLCTEDILDKKSINIKEPSLFYHQSLISTDHQRKCRLHKYTQADFVQCLEALPVSRVFFAFVGDSRIRQLYEFFMNVPTT